MDQILFFKNLPPAKHNKNKLFQVLDRDGRIYRSDGEFWLDVTGGAIATYATLPSASQYAGASYRLSDMNGGEMYSNGVRWLPRNGELIAANSGKDGPEFTLVDLNAMELENYLIPGKFLGMNGGVQAALQFLVTRGDGANTITFRMQLGSTVLADFQVTSPNIGAEVLWSFSNKDSEGAQQGMRTNYAGTGAYQTAANIAVGAIDTTQDQILRITVAANAVAGTTRDKVRVTKRTIRYITQG